MPAIDAPQKRFVLTIDGGGIRGIIPATILAELQARLVKAGFTKPLHAAFDLMAGTSTGSIIVAGLAAPKPNKPSEAAATPAELVTLFEESGPTIFPQLTFHKLVSVFGATDEKYDAAPLEKILLDRLGDRLIADGLTKVLIPAYNIVARRAEFFSNMDDDHARVLFREVVRGSTAAPAYFEPALIADLGSTNKKTIPMLPVIDGGMFANDPGMAAFVETRKTAWDDITVLSLGTGRQDRPISYQSAKNWGGLDWLGTQNNMPLISILMQGQSSTVSYQLNRILNPPPVQKHGLDPAKLTADQTKTMRYYRIDGDLGQSANDALDDASEKNIEALKALARLFITTHSKFLDAIVAKIVAAKP